MALAAREIDAEDDEGFHARGIMGESKERDEVQMSASGRTPLHAGAEKEFDVGCAVEIRAGGAFEVHFDSSAQLLIDEGVADALRKTGFGFTATAHFLFVECVESPVHTAGKAFAQEKFEFIGVGIVFVEFPLAI